MPWKESKKILITLMVCTQTLAIRTLEERGERVGISAIPLVEVMDENEEPKGSIYSLYKERWKP